jgi:putative transposase
VSKRLVTYKFKLKPTAEQEEKLGQWLGVCRLIYNLALDVKIQSYKKTGKSISRNELQTQVKDLSKAHDWINSVHSQVRQDPLVRLEKAYQHFFRGNGFPKFAKKDRYRSFTFPQGVKIAASHIQLPKIGKIKFHKGNRCVDDIHIKQATIKKDIKGWFISILFERDRYNFENNDKKIGLDLGVANYVVTSDGEFIANPKHLSKYQQQLRIAQRKISRRKKGSNRRRKAIAELQKVHLKIRNTRKDFLHKLSTRLINENQVIVVEKLNLSGMTSSAKGTAEEHGKMVKQQSALNRSLLDLAGSLFYVMLEYKAAWYGREFHRVDPKYTSQTCSACGHKDQANRKSQAVFSCNACGHKMNADHNAAINILGHPSGVINCVSGEPEKHSLYSLN